MSKRESSPGVFSGIGLYDTEPRREPSSRLSSLAEGVQGVAWHEFKIEIIKIVRSLGPTGLTANWGRSIYIPFEENWDKELAITQESLYNKAIVARKRVEKVDAAERYGSNAFLFGGQVPPFENFLHGLMLLEATSESKHYRESMLWFRTNARGYILKRAQQSFTRVTINGDSTPYEAFLKEYKLVTEHGSAVKSACSLIHAKGVPSWHFYSTEQQFCLIAIFREIAEILHKMQQKGAAVYKVGLLVLWIPTPRDVAQALNEIHPVIPPDHASRSPPDPPGTNDPRRLHPANALSHSHPLHCQRKRALYDL
ncbi:hypothetical protein JCM16303_006409 [Sporobolomyces ruberrimus]